MTPRFQSRHASTPFNSASDAFQLRPDVRRFVRTLDPQVLPECRVRVRLGNDKYSPNIYLRALPRQEIVARGRVPLLNTDLSLGVRVEVRLVPIRPRSRCARRSLRTFTVVTLHPRFPFNV